MIDFLLKINRDITSINKDMFLITPKLNLVHRNYAGFDINFWGDPIFTPNEDSGSYSTEIESLIPKMLQNVQGHYYFLIFDTKTNSFFAGNSLFSILPIYYSTYKENLYLSISPSLIAEHLNKRAKDKRFILENIIFNYPLFNNSAYIDINLLASNNYMKWWQGKLFFKKHTKIEEYFTFNKKKTKTDLKNLAELFIERSNLYFPNQTYIHALTGGLDGRTLVSCARYHCKQFETYSFGSNESTDIEVAEALSLYANIPYNKFLLDQNYIDNHSLSNGMEFIANSSGTAAFTRAHYLNSAKELSKKSNHLITGNFGSEIFRAPLTPGVVIGSNLFSIFKSKSFEEMITTLRSSPENKWLNQNEFKQEWASLIEDLRELSLFSSDYSDLSLNQKFYIIIFEEVFRKYFGAEIINQYKFIINRTPFLDFQFLKELMKSRLAGIHTAFLENNPFRRYKGQLLYSHIIETTYPDYGRIDMNKGYSPRDLLNLPGAARISKAYLQKKMASNNNNNSDPFSVKASFAKNHKYFMKAISDSQLFNVHEINSSFKHLDMSNSFFIAISQAIFYTSKLENE